MDLILTDTEGEEAADNLLAALSDLAYATPVSNPTELKKHRSRFFFTLGSSTEEEVKEKASKFKPKELVHIDAEIERRLKTYKAEVPDELAANIAVVRDFFLSKVSPKSLATGAGASQAREIVQRMIGSDIDSSQFDKFERMSAAAVNLSMARFIVNYYRLPKSYVTKVLDAITPRPPSTITFESPKEPRHVRQKKDTEGSKEGKAPA